MVNTLSNLQKRAIAYSGQADIGDVPPLYAFERAQQQAAVEDALAGGGGLPSGSGGVNPLTGGGGAVGGTADVGLPGGALSDPALEEEYTREFRRMQLQGGDAPDRGEIASRGAINLDPEDPFGLAFGQGIVDVTGLLSKAPGAFGTLASGFNKFAQLALMDAQLRSDQFFEGLATGENITVDPTSGITMTRTGTSVLDPGSSDLGGRGAGVGSAAPSVEAAAAAAAAANEAMGLSSDIEAGIRGRDGGDAGAGNEGGGSQGGGLCFAGGTRILMADGTERPIETIRLGDKVMAFSEGDAPEPREVIATFASQLKHVWRLNGDTLVTPGHRFFALINMKGHGFWPLEEIPVGATIMADDGSSIRVDTIEDAGERRDVFNFTVEGLHTYIANGYRVHNIKHDGGYIQGRMPGAEVRETLIDGEYVLNPEATQMLGRNFLDNANMMAMLARRR